MPDEPYSLSLTPGEAYTYNFPGCPSGRGTYLGTVAVGDSSWLVMQVRDRDGDGVEVRFYNPARLSTLRPESDPLRVA